MVNADGSTNASAVKGAEGLIGLMPSTLSGADAVVEPLVQGWRRASSSSCNGVAYCDADGDATSWPGYIQRPLLTPYWYMPMRWIVCASQHRRAWATQTRSMQQY
jgi:hypothetical protein